MSVQYEMFGKYALLEKLATGGMAEVFLARGTGAGGIGKFFAIKRILPQYADSPEFIDMFKDEAKIAINLSHSNIVSIHEFGVEKGQFFLVMDYVEGRNLRQILNKMKKTSLQFSIDQVVFMIKEVASGLDHAHRCIDGSTGKPLNITHRDMSPQNVMVSFEGEVKIVDFGIAKAESQLETTRAGTLKGKFGYMSPEQAEGQPVDLRTDIFSLGIVMWELLAHDRLFVANNEINTLRKIRDCQIPSLRKINPNIHGELERIVQKALARDRNLRYQTGAALQRDLNRFLNRQYPDFSAQDFSVFTKSVFADEILSLRKRLVEYTKLNLTPGQVAEQTRTRRVQADESDELDSTSLVDDSSSSQPQTSSSFGNSEVSVPSHTDEKTANSNSNSGVSIPDITNSVREMTVTEEPTERLHSNSSPTALTKVPSKEVTGIHTLPKPERASNNNSTVTKKSAAPTILSEEYLNSEQNRNLEAGKDRMPSQAGLGIGAGLGANLETEEVTSPSYVNRRPGTVNNARKVPSGPRKKSTSNQNAPARLATMFVFALICMSAYAYLVKYFTVPMAGVIALTDPYIGGVHDALGIVRGEPPGRIPSGSAASSIPENPPANLPPTNAATTPPPAANPMPMPAPVPTMHNSEPTAANMGLAVTSNPSGAEIFINNQSTGLSTPNRAEVPSNGTFTISLRKRGYRDFTKTEVTYVSLGSRLDASLQKTNIGFLDIEIFPPQDATLYVNGRVIPLHRNVAREIAVPGGTQVRVRADSRAHSTYDEKTVVVGVDRRKTIQLNPRKMQRQPSSNGPSGQ